VFLALKWLLPEGLVDSILNKQMGLTPDKIGQSPDKARQAGAGR
jgi:hypothetical protein